MATCKKGLPVPVPPPSIYTLILSEKEACTLRAILRKIGGCPRRSLRAESDAILSALNSAGVGGLPDTGIFQEPSSLRFLDK